MKNSICPRLLLAAAIAAVIGAATGAASASSFLLLEQSPARLGNAYAGTASAAADATTVYYNPAAMTQLEGRQISAGANFILLEAEFNPGARTNTAGPDGEVDEFSFIPNLYAAVPVNDRLWFGLGINVPFGLATHYDDDWVGRYHATDSELKVINVNATMAFAVTDRLSVGAGLNVQHIDATLGSAVDSFTACVGAPRTTKLGCATGAYGSALVFGARAQDSSVMVSGEDYGIGIDLSLFYEIADGTRMGLVYRQGIEFTLEGEADFDPSAACRHNAGCLAALSALDGDIKAEVELPDTLTFSISHDIGDAWTLHADIARTFWSSIQKIEIVNTENGMTVDTLVLNYDDTMRYSLGASYHAGASTWRMGVAFDEAPQTDPGYVTARIPSGDRIWLALGYGREFGRRASIDIAYAHIFDEGIEINSVEQGHRLRGEFEGAANIMSVQLNWRF